MARPCCMLPKLPLRLHRRFAALTTVSGPISSSFSKMHSRERSNSAPVSSGARRVAAEIVIPLIPTAKSVSRRSSGRVLRDGGGNEFHDVAPRSRIRPIAVFLSPRRCATHSRCSLASLIKTFGPASYSTAKLTTEFWRMAGTHIAVCCHAVVSTPLYATESTEKNTSEPLGPC